MLIVAVVLGVLCCILLFLLLAARKAVAEAKKAAVAATKAHGDEVQSLRGELAEREKTNDALSLELAAEQERADEVALEAKAQAADALVSGREAADLAETVGALSTDLDARQAELDAERDALIASADSLEQKQQELDDLVVAQRRLESDLEDAHEAAARARGSEQRVPLPELRLGDADDAGEVNLPGVEAATVWDLELLRSERTWRYSVSSNPLEDPSPFETTDNPLRLAIEIEGLALREDVGAFIGVRWDADQITDPARAHLILRLAQELMAGAAREPQASELIVEDGEDGVRLRIVAADEEDLDFRVAPPVVASDWIDVTDGGLVVSNAAR